jgi:hypothetical protein
MDCPVSTPCSGAIQMQSQYQGVAQHHRTPQQKVVYMSVSDLQSARSKESLIHSTKSRPKPTPPASIRVTRSIAASRSAGSSTKRASPTQDNSDLLRLKRARIGYQQSSTQDAVLDDLNLQCASYVLELLWWFTLGSQNPIITNVSKRLRRPSANLIFFCQPHGFQLQ